MALTSMKILTNMAHLQSKVIPYYSHPPSLADLLDELIELSC